MSQVFRTSRGAAAVAFVIVLALVLVAVASLGAIAYTNHLASEMLVQRVVQVENQELRAATLAQFELLAGRAMVDEEKGLARIPIEDAMKLVVLRERGKEGEGS